jgi:hypothetical protein
MKMWWMKEDQTDWTLGKFYVIDAFKKDFEWSSNLL